MTAHKKPDVAFWATIAVVVGLVYFSSEGPVMRMVYCWLGAPHWALASMHLAYAPSYAVIIRSPEPVQRAYRAYFQWWSTGTEDAAWEAAERWSRILQ